jgi:hypothetical protein
MADATMSQDQQSELLFMQLVMMFQGMVMQQLGKVMNPMTNQIDRDLGQAKNFIDLLGMLEYKTKGNLGEGESKLLQQALFDLRMNYVEELKKDNTPAETPDADDAAESDGDASTEASESDGGENEEKEAGLISKLPPTEASESDGEETSEEESAS